MAGRIKFIRQKDSMDCGVAALAMATQWFGREYPRDVLEASCRPTTQGVNLRALAETADGIGLRSRAMRMGVDDLAALTTPCILHWDQTHFVLLYGYRRGKFLVADPAKGLVRYTPGELADHWVSTSSNGVDRGIGLVLERTPSFGQRAVGGRDGKRSLRFLYRYIREYRRYLVQIFLGLLLGSVLQLVMPFLTQWIVDFGINRRDIGFIWLVLLGELMIVAGRTATDFVRRWLLLHISMRVNISLVSDFFIKLLRLPMAFFDTKLLGDLLQRIGDHGRVQSFLTGQVLGIVFSLINFAVFGIVLFIYDGLIFGVFLAGSVVYGAWLGAFLRRRKVLDYDLFEKQAAAQNRTYQFITAMQEIKLQDCRQRRRWEWEDSQADLFGVEMRSLKLQQTQEAGSIFINEVKNILITVLSATAVIDGTMTLGVMLAVQYIIGQLNSPVSQMMGFVYSLQDVKISLERINEIHGGPDEDDVQAAHCRSYAGERGIAIRGLDFRYDPHALAKTLDGVTLDIPAGRVTAIVGASGSGKTTLVKLMLGYYPVEPGAITVGGRSLRDYDLGWWRRQCGVVMQEGVVFSESIARNIAVGDGDIDTGRLERAARIANIHDYVMGLPLKYNTLVGRDGVGLSQGQKQRILIARAVYKDPDFIFLDEATNSLDAENERQIVENLARFSRGRTVVVVAHRLSTVRDADQIIVLDKGTVVETGDHDSLTRRRGVYYNLVRNQLELGG